MEWRQNTKIELAEAMSTIAKMAESANQLMLENSAVAFKS